MPHLLFLSLFLFVSLLGVRHICECAAHPIYTTSERSKFEEKKKAEKKKIFFAPRTQLAVTTGFTQKQKQRMELSTAIRKADEPGKIFSQAELAGWLAGRPTDPRPTLFCPARLGRPGWLSSRQPVRLQKYISAFIKV